MCQKSRLFLYLLMLPWLLSAQESENFQWFQYYLQGSSQGPFHWNMDAGFRFRSTFDEPSQYLIRASVGHAWKSGPTLNIGVAQLGDYSQSAVSRFEWRPYVGLLHGSSWRMLSFNHRMRLEYRHFRTIAIDPSDVPILSNRWRARYRLMVSYEIVGTRWKINVGDEFMMHYSFEEDSLAFNQNRMLIGPAFRLTPKLGLSFLLNFRQAGTSNGSLRNDTVFWLGVNQKL